MRATQEGYRGSATEVVLRTRQETRDLLGGLELVDPGMVDVVHWPVPDPVHRSTGAYGAIVRLP